MPLPLWECQQRPGQVRGARGSAILRGSPGPAGTGGLQAAAASRSEGRRDTARREAGEEGGREGQRTAAARGRQRDPRSGRSTHPVPAGEGFPCGLGRGEPPQPTLPTLPGTDTAGSPQHRAAVPPARRAPPSLGPPLTGQQQRAGAQPAGRGLPRRQREERAARRQHRPDPPHRSPRHLCRGRAGAVPAGGGDGGGAGPAVAEGTRGPWGPARARLRAPAAAGAGP